MKPAIHLVFSFSFLVVLQAANAEVGTLDEVVDAAKKNEEPAYIKILMAHPQRELYEIALSKKIDRAEQKLAWLRTMYAVVSVSYKAAWNAAFEAAGKAAEIAALAAAGNAALLAA